MQWPDYMQGKVPNPRETVERSLHGYSFSAAQSHPRESLTLFLCSLIPLCISVSRCICTHDQGIVSYYAAPPKNSSKSNFE